MTDEHRDWNTEFEMLQEMLSEILGEPCDTEETPDGAAVFIAGDPHEVVVRLTRSMLSVYRYDARWSGPHTLCVDPKIVGVLYWRRMTPATVHAACTSLIEGARRARQATFGTCRFCGGTIAPEHMHGDDVCHGCAENRLGVVH